MRQEVLDFIQQNSFPCIMAKAVAKQGYLDIQEIQDIAGPEVICDIQQRIYRFIDCFRENQGKLSSFMLIIKNQSLEQFDQFERSFYQFLSLLNQRDKLLHAPDPRVSSDVSDNRFSFSLKSEAFFLLALHPESPRWARRFRFPAIVFNPHVQFERLREKNLYLRIRNIIRSKDRLLQGSINPMLNDFGERSEVFQYLGKVYGPQDRIPLQL